MRNNMSNRITLKDMSIEALIDTFDEGVPLMETLYSAHAKTLDRLIIKGNGLDYLTILYRTLTPCQQQKMYLRILKKFTNDQKKYIENPIVSFFLHHFEIFQY